MPPYLPPPLPLPLPRTALRGLPLCKSGQALVEDLDQDGWSDIVFTNHYSSYTGYSVDSYVYYGSATGFSASNRDDITTDGAVSSASGDFNGDGLADLAFGGYFNHPSYLQDTYVYYGTTTGYSSASSDSFTGLGVFDTLAADLDSDGYDELVLATYYTGSSYAYNAYIYKGTSSGVSTSATMLDTVGTRKVTVGDLDADGHPELIFNTYYTGNWSSPDGAYVYWGSSGAYTEADRTILDTAGALGPSVLVGDASW